MQVMTRTSKKAGGLKGPHPLKDVTGETPNIYEYLYFVFYDHVLYKYNDGLGMKAIGRWLRVSHMVGGLISYWIKK